MFVITGAVGRQIGSLIPQLVCSFIGALRLVVNPPTSRGHHCSASHSARVTGTHRAHLADYTRITRDLEYTAAWKTDVPLSRSVWQDPGDDSFKTIIEREKHFFASYGLALTTP